MDFASYLVQLRPLQSLTNPKGAGIEHFLIIYLYLTPRSYCYEEPLYLNG
jgi:hypothetical protein